MIRDVSGPAPIGLPTIEASEWADRLLVDACIRVLGLPAQEWAIERIAILARPSARAYALEKMREIADTSSSARSALVRLEAHWKMTPAELATIIPVSDEEIEEMRSLLTQTLDLVSRGHLRGVVVCAENQHGRGISFEAGDYHDQAMLYALELGKARIINSILWAENEGDDEGDDEDEGA